MVRERPKRAAPTAHLVIPTLTGGEVAADSYWRSYHVQLT